VEKTWRNECDPVTQQLEARVLTGRADVFGISNGQCR